MSESKKSKSRAGHSSIFGEVAVGQKDIFATVAYVDESVAKVSSEHSAEFIAVKSSIEQVGLGLNRLEQKVDAKSAASDSKLLEAINDLASHVSRGFSEHSQIWDARMAVNDKKWDTRMEAHHKEWDARMEANDKKWDARMEAQDAKLETALTAQSVKLETALAAQSVKLETALAAQSVKLEAQVEKINASLVAQSADVKAYMAAQNVELKALIAAQNAKSDASFKEMYTRLDAKYHDSRILAEEQNSRSLLLFEKLGIMTDSHVQLERRVSTLELR